MLKGYTLPFTPTGNSSLVKSPPWYYAGDIMAIEFWPDKKAIAELLPIGLTLSDTTTKCVGHFVEWQAATENGNELLDPVCSQYKEFFILISAQFEGREIYYCPYIYVDQDTSLLRGLIQGLPKQIGSIYRTRSYNLDSKAAGKLKAEAKLGGSCAFRDRRIADGEMTLKQISQQFSGIGEKPIFGVRHFPEIDSSKHGEPAVHELVEFSADEVSVGEIWEGEGKLSLFSSPHQEIANLRPKKSGKAFRFEMALKINHAISHNKDRANRTFKTVL